VRAKLHSGSSIYALDADRLDALDPDLIVTQELCEVCAVSYEIVQRAVKRMRGDARVISLEPTSLEDVYATIVTLGELTEHSAQAADLLDALRARAAHLRASIAPITAGGRAERRRTLVLEWTDPPMNAGHWTPGLVALAGGDAVLGNPGHNSQVLTWSQIAAEDPDVIVVAPCGFDLAKTRAAAAALADHRVWQSLRAYAEREIYLMDGNAYVNRPGPRLIDTAEILATILYEDAIDVAVLDPQAWEPLHA
jgi:iron complex transport system substrate-binding protein